MLQRLFAFRLLRLCALALVVGIPAYYVALVAPVVALAFLILLVLLAVARL